MRRSLFLPLILAACSQGATSSEPPGATTTTAVTVAAAPAPAAAAPAATSGASSWSDERDFAVPAEKFSDPQRNFEAAKKAILDGYYSGSLTDEDLYRAAVAGMLERADPTMRKWHKLLSPSDLADLKNDLQGEVVGVGVVIGFDAASGYIDVKGTIPGSPAERAGLAPPDKIVTVDGKLYRGLTLKDVTHGIRGKAGEKVTLTVLRGDKLVTVPIVREKVVYDVVRGEIVGDHAGYVRIPSFNAKTPTALHDVLLDLESKGATSLVLDLRSNQGGMFDEAVACAGELVPAGSTVVTLNRRGKGEPVVPKTTPLMLDRPIAVLVDHDTASSAELFAAALKELRHATLVGQHTKGKWTVQRIEDLPNGYAMKFTTALFASPEGHSYEGTGMSPDLEVDEADEAVQKAIAEKDPVKRVAEDMQLRTALAIAVPK
jgi:carboxyl-terminal processing protease